MSTCYKCGRELPGTEVECENGCPSVGGAVDSRDAGFTRAAAASNETEFNRGVVAAYQLCKHVIAMGAGGMDVTVDIGGQVFRVTVSRRA